tara:strand:- start:121 stop:486 length:366 start_codon:yes stop_codon:yes gene_type:complete
MPKVIIDSAKGLHQVAGSGPQVTVNGTVPTIALTNGSGGGAPVATIESQSTDMAGIINVTTQLENTDTLVVTFAEQYESVPVVVVTSLTNYKVTSTVSNFTVTATGNTGTGELHYLAVRSV